MRATPDLAETISSKLRELMDAHDQMAQRELAEAIGVNVMSLNRVIRAVGTPTADVIVKIALFYQITTDELLGLSARKTARKRATA